MGGRIAHHDGTTQTWVTTEIDFATGSQFSRLRWTSVPSAGEN